MFTRYFLVLYGGFAVLVGAERIVDLLYCQRRRIAGKITDQQSLTFMALVHGSVITASFLECLLLDRRISLIPVIAGLVVWGSGVATRWWANNTLGSYMSLHIEIRPLQPVITSGPYAYLRHPRYFANIAEVLAVPLIGQAWIAFAFALISYVPLTWLRIIREEKALLEALGIKYSRYRSQVSLLPLPKRRT